ncbi:MAG: 30S ribosomal protein S10 [Acholeplasmatales bacterium]|jgi:small subunit ribosomal protein S10|nr:30S ribosomal protein S10 [Acholeplasmatales bacterium]
MANFVLKVKMRSYDHQVLDQKAKEIVEGAAKTGALVDGPIPLPTKREIFTVLRSPHVNKDSREQFERRTHKRLILITNPNGKTLDLIKSISMPSSIEVEVKRG